MSLPRHDSRPLERGYYRRVELSILLALAIHAAVIWLSPPYVPRPYRLDASPLRLVAAARIDAGLGSREPALPSAPATPPAAEASRRRVAIVTEQLRLSTQEPPAAAEPAQRTGRAAEGAPGAPGIGAGDGAFDPPVFYAFDSPPKVVDRVVPDYPALAKSQGLEGSVVLNANVDEGGRVIRVWVARATAAEILIEAAVDALYRSRFAPGSQQGIPVKCTVAVPFNFRLNMHL